MAKSESQLSALAQAFYLSEQFQGLEIETRDYREHPVLGGISSTRWGAYESFSSENSRLVDILTDLQATAGAIQLHANGKRHKLDASYLESANIAAVDARDYALKSSGFLSGDKRANRLRGSFDSDLLMGWVGRDVLIGGQGDDILSGGRDADRFQFGKSRDNKVVERDEIVDFDGEEGDRIVLRSKNGSAVNEFSGNKGDVIFATWMARYLPDDGEVLQPWMYCGTHISVDRNGDKIADLFVDLPGVSNFQAGWIVFQ
ncbi:MAG: calcium-binding protein [Cyanobacteria bacterium M_surface_7_m2_037]|nr:calcium-binding protein [Cyanobacteria bacterium M_surface_7_m2_037]